MPGEQFTESPTDQEAGDADQQRGRLAERTEGLRQVVPNFSTDGRGVSPVIGVILMVAITVILAAVVATFVLGIGEGIEPTPSATFEIEKIEENGGGSPDELEITHTSGDAIDAENLYVIIEGVQVQEAASGTPGPADRHSWDAWAGYSSGEQITVGDSLSPVEPDNSNPQIEGKTVRVIWEGQEGSSTLKVWEAPDN